MDSAGQLVAQTWMQVQGQPATVLLGAGDQVLQVGQRPVQLDVVGGAHAYGSAGGTVSAVGQSCS
jgi:hypothetical protein